MLSRLIGTGNVTEFDQRSDQVKITCDDGRYRSHEIHDIVRTNLFSFIISVKTLAVYNFSCN